MSSQMVEKKRISVSRKRQITIPIEFFNSLGIKNEVDCYMQDNQLIIKPAQDYDGEFAEQILSDLIAQGFSGEELLLKFKESSRNLQTAVKNMLEEADRVAKGEGEYYTLDDLIEDNDV